MSEPSGTKKPTLRDKLVLIQAILSAIIIELDKGKAPVKFNPDSYINPSLDFDDIITF